MNQHNVVLVTGSSSGFGRLMVETLARRGHTVWAGIRQSEGRNQGAADAFRELAAREGLPIHVVELDVVRGDSVEAAVQAVVASSGRIDVAINNAGTGSFGVAEAFTPEQLTTLFDTNVNGPLRVNRAVLPAMREARRGLLVQIGTSISHLPIPFMGPYCASKVAAETMAEILRYELSAFGVDSVIVQPGAYPTNIMAGSLQPADGARLGGYGPVFPVMEQMGRSLEWMFSTLKPDPQEVADAVLSLVEMAPGTRPLRTLVGSTNAEGAAELNAARGRTLAAYYGLMGVDSMLELKSA